MVIVFENVDTTAITKECIVCGNHFVTTYAGPDACNADCFNVAERTKVMELHIRKLNDDEA